MEGVVGRDLCFGWEEWRVCFLWGGSLVWGSFFWLVKRSVVREGSDSTVVVSVMVDV
jgi:hypothetical protein